MHHWAVSNANTQTYYEFREKKEKGTKFARDHFKENFMLKMTNQKTKLWPS